MIIIIINYLVLLCYRFVNGTTCLLKKLRKKYGKDYCAANKEKFNGYSKSYSKEHNRNEYYEKYYACDRDLSQKRSAATSRFTYHKNLEKNRSRSAAQSKASYHRSIEKSQADSAKRERLFLGLLVV